MRRNRAFIAAKQSFHCGKTEPSFRQNRAFIPMKRSFYSSQRQFIAEKKCEITADFSRFSEFFRKFVSR
ncbi:hypothetical protein JCM6292_3509 [Bacteroides pyogenes JCM 6292]|uniref:Uncharacterized protein n=1 Tax=Bacteroides pyogenes JCM 6292 TaxID=1235809 RepID=W4PB78_9BACE|nr:hypothetical protein JCM6292_3509 [Bacteroides pyogenes JCM 6292]